MVVVTDDISSEEHRAVAEKIYTKTLSIRSLTPRPRHELESALDRHDIALAFDGDKLMGWVLATPHTKAVQELGMAYIFPDYRDRGIFIKLMDKLVDKRPVAVAATYEQRLVDILIDNWGFERSSLWRLAVQTKGRFVTSRLKSLQKLRSVSGHLHEQSPSYLIRKKR